MGLSLIYFMFLILRKVNLIRRHFAKELVFHNCFNISLTHIKTWCQIWTNRINRWRKAEMNSIKISKNPEHYRPVTSVSYSWLNGNHLYGRRRRWISRSRSELFAISGNHRSPTCLTTFLNLWLKKINDIGFACISLFKGTQYELVFYTMIGLDDSIENKVCPLNGPLIGGYIPWRSKQENTLVI